MKHSNYYTDFDVNEKNEGREEDYIQLTNLSKNFFDKSQLEMSQEEAIELYEKLQAGEISKEYYTMRIIYSLANYCNIQLTNLSKNFFDKSQPEMSQEEAIELYEKLQAGEISKEYYTMRIIYSLTNYPMCRKPLASAMGSVKNIQINS